MLKAYLESMKTQVQGKDRVNNRHKQIEDTVIQLIKQGKPTTVKTIKSLTGISTIQQVHSIVTLSEKKGGSLKRVTVNGATLIVVNDELL